MMTSHQNAPVSAALCFNLSLYKGFAEDTECFKLLDGTSSTLGVKALIQLEGRYQQEKVLCISAPL